MRGDYAIGERSTGLLRATELSKVHGATSRRTHTAPHCPRRDLRAGFDWLFARVFDWLFEWLFDWLVAIKFAENPAIPNAAPPAGFAPCRHLYVAPMSVHKSRTRASDLAHDRAPHTRRLRHRLRAGYATLPRHAPHAALARGRSARREWGAGRGWLGVAPVSPVRSSGVSHCGFDGGHVSRTPPPFAGFAFCRHPYVTQRSVRESGLS